MTLPASTACVTAHAPPPISAMIDPDTPPDAATMFDAAFHSSPAAGDRGCRAVAEDASHASFIVALNSACAPMAGLLPAFMLEQQSAMQEAAYRHAFPAAMWRVALHRDRPVGRIIVDWTPGDHSLGVDLAVLPDERATGAGLAMLRAWLKVSDLLIKPARLTVRRDNVAARIYARLGFQATGDDMPDSPTISMIRAIS
jgi:GNAT superfamily N-acetyltransferase